MSNIKPNCTFFSLFPWTNRNIRGVRDDTKNAMKGTEKKYKKQKTRLTLSEVVVVVVVVVLHSDKTTTTTTTNTTTTSDNVSLVYFSLPERLVVSTSAFHSM